MIYERPLKKPYKKKCSSMTHQNKSEMRYIIKKNKFQNLALIDKKIKKFFFKKLALIKYVQ